MGPLPSVWEFRGLSDFRCRLPPGRNDSRWMIGQVISHYRIEERLGVRMGLVYEAEDTRLDHFVALKVLPEGLANDARFCFDWIEGYGRPEWTRTIDLLRVKVRLTHTYNNFRVPPETAKPL